MPTLKQLIAPVANRTSLQKTQVGQAFEVLAEEMSQAMLRGEKVVFAPIGTLTVKTSPPTTGRNPRTGETLQIGERKKVRFKMSNLLGDRLNPPKAAAPSRRRA